MVNLVHQLDLVKGYPNVISGCVQGNFQLILAFESVASLNITLPNKCEHHPIHWGLNRIKGEIRGDLSLFASGLAPWAGTSAFSFPWTEVHTIGSPESQAFRLRLKLALPGIQLAVGRSWVFSAFIIGWANSSQRISSYIHPSRSASLGNPDWYNILPLYSRTLIII